VFFTFAAYCEVRGFGLAGIGDLGRSTAPLNDLANRYTSRTFAVALDVAAAFSGFSGALGSLTAAGRLLFALGREGLATPLGRTHGVHGTPGTAVVLCGILATLAFLAWGPNTGAAGYYANVSTVGALALILVYLGVVAAFCRQAFRRRRRLWPTFTIVGGIILIWCLINTVYPVPAYPDYLWPYVVIAWVAVGVVLLWLRPALASEAMLDPVLVDPVAKAGAISSEA
jgi:amino acid transporter